MKTEEEVKNEKKFMDLLAKTRPDLWAIEVYRQELGFGDIGWLKDIMNGLFNIAYGSAYGEVTIEIKDKKVFRVRSNESKIVDKPIFP